MRLILISFFFSTCTYGIPTWVNQLPRAKGQVFVLGEAHDIEKKEDALERAWVSALLRMGMAQFPEVGKLTSESYETLHDADYQRRFVLSLDRISWKGLSETQEPFVIENESGFTVYRLLKWSQTDISYARKHVRPDVHHALPQSPEATQRVESELIDQVQQIHEVNRKVAKRKIEVGKVLNRLECGVTIEDLKKILGPPDDEDFSDYVWGTYKVEGVGPVMTITTNYGNGYRRDVCGHKE